jgi:octaprenyl-diphosphate synthase
MTPKLGPHPTILKEITASLREELSSFEQVFRQTMRSKIPFVDTIARYLVRQKGKKIRPLLVLLSADLCGGISEGTYRGAALVEILHTATLIHDDVVDDADTRRGLASINAVWKNKVAVLMGDYLYAKGLLLSLDHNDVHFLQIISNAVRRMSEGEIYQIAKSRALDIDEKTYLRIIGDKTASLFSTCCEIGAASATSDAAILERLRRYGENLGIAFQIRDDVLDYIGRKSITGKPKGLDLSEKKLTLPLIQSLKKAPRREAKKILRLVKNGTNSKVLQTIIQFTHERGGIDYAAEQALYYSSLAKEDLAPLPESETKTKLMELTEFVASRTK